MFPQSRSAFFVAALILSIGAAAEAKRKGHRQGKLTGNWEIQSLGGDREVQIEHKGRGFTAIRVMWQPTEEGDRFRLEHRFKGRVTGKEIKGQLFVKEGKAGKLLPLRNFRGSIESKDEITLDGMRLLRVLPPAKAAPTEPAPQVAKAPPPPGPPPPPGSLPPPEPAVELSEPVAALVKEGDELVAAKKLKSALGCYDKAIAKKGPRGFLLLKIGQTFIAMGRTERAKRALRNALKADPQNHTIQELLSGLEARGE